MSTESESQQLVNLFRALTDAGTFGLAVLANPHASEIAKADASALVEVTARRLQELTNALNEDDLDDE
jgi:hypothetical protein